MTIVQNSLQKRKYETTDCWATNCTIEGISQMLLISVETFVPYYFKLGCFRVAETNSNSGFLVSGHKAKLASPSCWSLMGQNVTAAPYRVHVKTLNQSTFILKYTWFVKDGTLTNKSLLI